MSSYPQKTLVGASHLVPQSKWVIKNYFDNTKHSFTIFELLKTFSCSVFSDQYAAEDAHIDS